MDKKIPDHLGNEESLFKTLFNERDKSPEIYFNYEAGFWPPEVTFYPLPYNPEDNYSDDAFFKLGILLPLSLKKYTAVDLKARFGIDEIENAAYLIPTIKDILWYEFTEPLIKQENFTHYPRTWDYLDYHYNWYQTKGGKAINWLRYFEHAWTHDERIIKAKKQHQEGISLINILRTFNSVIGDVEEWLSLKKKELVTSQSNVSEAERIKFHSNGATFAFITKQLVDMGVIPAPRNRNQEDDAEKILKSMLQHFEVTKPNTGQEYSMEYLIKAYKEHTLSRENEAAYKLKPPLDF